MTLQHANHFQLIIQFSQEICQIVIKLIRIGDNTCIFSSYPQHVPYFRLIQLQ